MSVFEVSRRQFIRSAALSAVTAVVVAVAPRIWSAANAHEELPVELPPFQPLAQRSYAYDVFGNEIAVFELENSQPIALAQVPQHVIDAFLAVEDQLTIRFHAGSHCNPAGYKLLSEVMLKALEGAQ